MGYFETVDSFRKDTETLFQFSVRTGISYNNLIHWRGGSHPTIAKIHATAIKLGCPAELLLMACTPRKKGILNKVREGS